MLAVAGSCEEEVAGVSIAPKATHYTLPSSISALFRSGNILIGRLGNWRPKSEPPTQQNIFSEPIATRQQTDEFLTTSSAFFNDSNRSANFQHDTESSPLKEGLLIDLLNSRNLVARTNISVVLFRLLSSWFNLPHTTIYFIFRQLTYAGCCLSCSVSDIAPSFQFKMIPRIHLIFSCSATVIISLHPPSNILV